MIYFAYVRIECETAFEAAETSAAVHVASCRLSDRLDDWGYADPLALYSRTWKISPLLASSRSGTFATIHGAMSPQTPTPADLKLELLLVEERQVRSLPLNNTIHPVVWKPPMLHTRDIM